MAQSTPATLALQKAGMSFQLHPYDYDPHASSIGLAAAENLGLDPKCVFKTLMMWVDKTAVCVVAPSDTEVNLKRVASHFKGKSASMMAVADAERLTGYKVGGISPFGQKKRAHSVFDESAQLFDTIYINAGQRGLLLSITPDQAARYCDATFSHIAL